MSSFEDMEDLIVLTYQCLTKGYGLDYNKISKKGDWHVTIKMNTTGEEAIENYDCSTKEFKESILVDSLVLYHMIGKPLEDYDLFCEFYGDGWFPRVDDDLLSISNIKVVGPDGEFNLALIDDELAKNLVTAHYRNDYSYTEDDIDEIVNGAFGDNKQK